MGGKALKKAYTRRVSKKEYDLRWKLISDKLQTMGWIGRDLPGYRKKSDFGDMDVLILNEGNLGNIKEKIQDQFSPQEIFVNGSVYSFDFMELQIDFILTPSRNWESAYNFFSWNDLGNFIGKIAHKFGLKWGFDGLVYVYRAKNDSRILGTVNITKDPESALTFLGFDYERWLDGFDTMEDIFNYIISSEYFNPDIFRIENLSSEHKNRNKRRKMYLQFIEYCENKELRKYQFKKDKKKYFPKVERAFPGFLNELSVFDKKEKEREAIANKFNGIKIIEKYGIEGKFLGDVIRTFKSEFTDFNKYILSTNEKKIWKDFDVHLRKFQGYLKRKTNE